MKEITFAEMEISDFKAFIGTHRLELRRLGNGVHFVSGINEVEPRLGSNGASKSSIWDALSWCLFGRTPAGLRGTDVRTWGGKEHADVGVRVVEASKRVQSRWVRRSTKTNGLTIDDKLVEQSEVDRLIGMSFDTFIHTILLGQGQPLFFDLGPADKMSRLSEALNLDRWEERSEAAKKAANELALKVREAEGQRKTMDQQLVDAETSESDLIKRRDEWETQQKKAAKERAGLLREAQKRLKAVEKEKGDADLALDRNETEARDQRKRWRVMQGEHQQAMSAVGASSAALGILLDERQRLASDEAPESCPTCGQKISGNKAHRQHIEKRLRELDKETETARGLHASLLDGAANKQKQIDRAAADLDKFEAAADDARDTLTRMNKEHAELSERIKTYESAGKESDEAVNPYAELAKKATRQANQLHAMLEELDTLIAAGSRKEMLTRYWVQGFKQVRLYLLQEVLDELSAAIQNLLPQIGLEGWICEMAPERESSTGKVIQKLHVDIFKPGLEKKARWESWSGGEAQRLRLVGAIALSQVLLRRSGVDCNLLILDEPTRHLSEQGVVDMIDFLVDIGRDYQIFYIDHTARPTKRFASGINVRRDAAGAKLELA